MRMSRTGMTWLAVALLMISLCKSGLTQETDWERGVECFTCVNTKVAAEGVIGNILGSDEHTQKACDGASILTGTYSGLDVEECMPGEMCAAVRGQFTFSDPTGIFGSVTTETVVRGCLPAIDTGCVPGTHTAGKLLSLFTADGVDVDGEVCFCDSDLCSAGPCPSDYLRIGDYCIEWYMVLAGVIAGILGLLIVTCCCCCCCCKCCCKSKASGGTILVMSPNNASDLYPPTYTDTDPIVTV